MPLILFLSYTPLTLYKVILFTELNCSKARNEISRGREGYGHFSCLVPASGGSCIPPVGVYTEALSSQSLKSKEESKD